jgi:hypothetical protein
MKASLLSLSALVVVSLSTGFAQPTTFTLNPLTTFGSRGDGSIQPGDSLGLSPVSGNEVKISAPGGYGIQPGDASNSTNGFNMRGLAFDPVSGNVILVDTHSGSGGSTVMLPNSGVYVLDPNSGQIIGALNTNGLVGSGGVGPVAAVAVADDGVVYGANQNNHTTNTSVFRIYRWATADTNSPSFGQPAVLAFSGALVPDDRVGQTIDVRGSGPSTQIIIGTSALTAPGTGTNVYLFTTADGTNFTSHRLSIANFTNVVLNDGIAFGPGNTFFVKQVGQPLIFLAFDPVAFTGSVIASYPASSANDPLLNLSALAVDNAHHLLAGLEEIGGTATGGRGKVWLFDIFDPSNHAPAVLTSRTYTPNFQKATAPMGYLDFGNGRLYVNVVNNGLLASTVDSTPMAAPTFTLDLPTTTRVGLGQTAHLEVFASPDVTNYQWYTNNVLIPGAASYYLDVPNVQTNNAGTVYKVVASNAAGSATSANSTLAVITGGNFHPDLLWSKTANSAPLSDPTNYITSTGGSTTPNERCIAYNALSNQLLVARGPSAFTSLRISVVNPDTGAFLYKLNTNGMTSGGALNLCGIGVADDGAVYACSVAASDQTFRVYRWADTGSNTPPQIIWGTNSSAAQANPIADLTGSQLYRFGDTLAVHGAGNNTEIILDAQNSTKFVGILRPVPDGTMTNWTQTGYLLQNTQGSYGSEAYGTAIGRSLQPGPVMPSPLGGNLPTFWQKRFTTPSGLPGAPLAGMSYNPGGGISALNVANVGLPLFTNGSVAINFTLNVAAAVSFAGTVANNLSAPDTLAYYDLTDPSQAVLLITRNLPGANGVNGYHLANGNAIAQVIFGLNPATGSNYIFAIDGNNGIAAFLLQGGVVPPPKLLTQPRNVRLLAGSSGLVSVALDQPATVQWYKGTNPPVDTAVRGNSYSITNAQFSDAGDYFVVATNLSGSVTSQVAHVSVASPNDNYTLAPSWQAVPGNANFPYVSMDGGSTTPNERSFAYNALSNQLIVVRCPPSSLSYTVSVVSASSGAKLYELNTTGVIHEGPSEVGGFNPVDLVAAAVADDGALYTCCETPNASGGVAGDTTKMLHVYRWPDSGPATLPVMIFQGDPANQPPGANFRWGDVMAARGSGTNTELLLDSNDGSFGAVLKPTDSTMTVFTNYWFAGSAGAGSIGRSIQFGPTNTVYEKRKGAALFYSSYNLAAQSSTPLLSVDSSTTLGGVAVDSAHNLVAGVDFVGSTTAPLKPDAVALFDISDPTAPMLLNRYNFPVNEVANANFICQTLIVGSRVYSLDANNGLMAFDINPSVNSMTLKVAPAGANVSLSWGNPQAILQGSPALNPSSWTDLTTAGQTNSVQPASGAGQFYRLIQRR